jgi:integration host factor subunit alpha
LPPILNGIAYPVDVDGKSLICLPFDQLQGVVSAMTTTTLTRADLTEAVFQAVGLSRNESAQMVEDILEELCSALARGETVKLSSFGTFAVRQKSQRMGRNPKTGDEVPIAPRRVLVFRPSHVLKAVINGQTPTNGAGEDD